MTSVANLHVKDFYFTFLKTNLYSKIPKLKVNNRPYGILKMGGETPQFDYNLNQ